MTKKEQLQRIGWSIRLIESDLINRMTYMKNNYQYVETALRIGDHVVRLQALRFEQEKLEEEIQKEDK